MARRLLAALSVLLLGLTLTGCDRGATTGPVSPDQATQHATQATLDTVAAAVLGQDRAAFDAAVDTTDPALRTVAGRLYRLGAHSLVDLALQVRGPRRPGDPGTWEQSVTVQWRLADDRGGAEHVVDVDFRAAKGRVRIVGVGEPRDGVAVPLWWQQEVAFRRAGRVTVLGPDDPIAAAWLKRGQAAVTAVARRLHPEVAPGWPRSLVIEVPTTPQVFERVLGGPPGRYAQIAAVTWPEGPDPADAALRVVVNPALAARLDSTGLAVLLAHEVVHVATRSAASGAPVWLVEGYADYLAYAAYPAAATAAERELLAGVRASSAPPALPRDADFRPDTPSLSREYALAWSVCRFVAADTSPGRLARLYELANRGQSLDRAVPQTLGIDLDRLTARWQRDLTARASGG